MKYIDAEKLKAEIKRLEVLYDEALKNPSFASYESSLIAKGKHRQREDLLSFIDSLQQEQQEGDLAENIEMEWDSFNKNVAEYDGESEDVVWLNWFSFTDIATYFYELGLKARKV